MQHALADVSLDDKYTQSSGPVLLSGNLALVRLLLLQRQLDIEARLDTTGSVSGYRGSPLGGLDLELWANLEQFEKSHVVFRPGVTRILRPPRCGARSRPCCCRARSTTASSPSGTARARASTAAAMSSSTATARALRRTPFDVFGCGAERRLERRLLAEYEARITEILERLDVDTHAVAVELAALPEQVRGFCPVKAEYLEKIRPREQALLAQLRGEAASAAAA